MNNSDILKELFSSFGEEKEINEMNEEYELSELEKLKIKDNLIEKAIEFDSQNKIISLAEWKEVYMYTVMMITSTHDGGKEPLDRGDDFSIAPKNDEDLIPKSVNIAISKVIKNYHGGLREPIEDNYDDEYNEALEDKKEKSF